MPPKPEPSAESERLARLAQEWFADVRRKNPDETPPSRKQDVSGDSLFDGLFGSGDGDGGGDGGD